MEQKYLSENPQISSATKQAIKDRKVIIGMTHEQMAIATGMKAIGEYRPIVTEDREHYSLMVVQKDGTLRHPPYIPMQGQEMAYIFTNTTQYDSIHPVEFAVFFDRDVVNQIIRKKPFRKN